MRVSHNFTPATMDVHIPIRLKRRGGRKLIVTPEGNTLAPPPAQKREPDAPLTKALLKAWKWQKDLESGKAQSMEAIAERDKIDRAGVSRLMRLNFLAPDLKLAILEGTQPKTMQLQDLIRKAWPDDGMSLAVALPLIWDAETQALFAAVMAFWFGQRALRGR